MDPRVKPAGDASGELNQSGRGILQRLDRDLAEFDGARAVLQREMPLLEHAVADVDGFLPVEHHDEMPAIGARSCYEVNISTSAPTRATAPA